MQDSRCGPRPANGRKRRHVLIAVIGVVLGGVFLWLAVRHIDPREVEFALRNIDRGWLAAGIAIYLGGIGLRCLRWGVLLRATGAVKWRHASEALITGFAANYILPGRVGELFRADYARRVFKVSRFTALGTILVERVCDGVVLVLALWIGIAQFLFARPPRDDISWILAVGAVSAALFGAAVILILASQRIELRRLGTMEAIAARWDRLIAGTAPVLRGRIAIVALCSLAVWALEAGALGSIARSFGVALSPSELLMLLGLASLSTLVPTAPGYVGAFQLVFGHVFTIFGHPETIGVIVATAIQIFFFGTVTVIGCLVLLSRSGITIWRVRRRISF
jgi:glycosyltransferase 2 family protein